MPSGKTRCASVTTLFEMLSYCRYRMAASREKLKASRRKKLEAKEAKATSIRLVEPMAVESPEREKVREKIKVSAKSRSALIPGEGRSMGMDID